MNQAVAGGQSRARQAERKVAVADREISWRASKSEQEQHKTGWNDPPLVFTFGRCTMPGA